MNVRNPHSRDIAYESVDLNDLYATSYGLST